jgi:hypothetical protein
LAYAFTASAADVREIDLDSHRAGDPVERIDRRIRVGAFELGDRGLADAGELRELGLGEAKVLAHPAQFQLHGELRFDGHPEDRALSGLERARRPWREHAFLQPPGSAMSPLPGFANADARSD